MRKTFVVVVLLAAGCAAPPEAPPSATLPDAPVAPPPVLLDEQVDSGLAREGAVRFSLASDAAVWIRIVVQEGAYAELRFAGPGECASALRTGGSAILAEGVQVFVAGAWTNEAVPCGTLAAGDHDLRWELAAGTFKARITVGTGQGPF